MLDPFPGMVPEKNQPHNMRPLTQSEMNQVTGGNPVLLAVLTGIVIGVTVSSVSNIENNWADFKAGFSQGFNNALK
jgi:hypothetical protein